MVSGDRLAPRLCKPKPGIRRQLRENVPICSCVDEGGGGVDEEMVSCWDGVECCVISCFCKMGKQICSHALQLWNESVYNKMNLCRLP